MPVVFLTTPTVDCGNHVQTWRSVAPAERLVFNHRGIRVDWKIAKMVRDYEPTLVFYIGANQGPFCLKPDTFQQIREFVPTINLCSDAADKPWHGTLRHYRERKCFDLQVGLDGHRSDNVDLATLTPVDPRPYEGKGPEKDIRCGFSGGIGRLSGRSDVIYALAAFGHLATRQGARQGGYEDHVKFIRRCRMILNTSWTGTGLEHHVKGRVVEAGWAKCCLLESAGSPIGDWFPKDCYFIWRNAQEAADIIMDASDSEIDSRARRLSDEVRTRFRPEMIYGEILRQANVRDPYTI